MSSGIDEQEVHHIARQSRLKLTAHEVDRLSTELSTIVDYVDQLNRANTDGVEPTAHPLPVRNVFREDRVGESLDPQEALSNAPQRDQAFFRVPKVLDQQGA